MKATQILTLALLLTGTAAYGQQSVTNATTGIPGVTYDYDAPNNRLLIHNDSKVTLFIYDTYQQPDLEDALKTKPLAINVPPALSTVNLSPPANRIDMTSSPGLTVPNSFLLYKSSIPAQLFSCTHSKTLRCTMIASSPK